MPRVLLVEDDRSLGTTLAERLEREKVDVTWVETLAAARTAVASKTWDLAIIDVMLPDGSGFDLTPELRKRSLTPIMFMTALNSAESRLKGFELGADEVPAKAVSPQRVSAACAACVDDATGAAGVTCWRRNGELGCDVDRSTGEADGVSAGAGLPAAAHAGQRGAGSRWPIRNPRSFVGRAGISDRSHR